MRLTNKFNLPQSFVNCVESLVYDPRESNPNRISVTSLINNPLPKLLSVAHWDELEEDVSDHIWRIFGSAAHYVLAQIDKDKEKSINHLIEQKITEVVDGITIVGKLDLYDANTQAVEDYKFTSIWSVKFGEHEEWEKQLNPYAWLLRKAGFEVKSLQINAVLKDWRRGESLKDSDYPKIPFKVIKVDLWSFEEQQKFVEERVALYKAALSAPLNQLEVCNEKERWHRPDTYAVYKNSNKRAEKLFDNEAEAEEYANRLETASKGKDKFYVAKRVGVDGKCTDYCTPNRFCRYYQAIYGQTVEGEKNV
jgi:hypothetical protein